MGFTPGEDSIEVWFDEPAARWDVEDGGLRGRARRRPAGRSRRYPCRQRSGSVERVAARVAVPPADAVDRQPEDRGPHLQVRAAAEEGAGLLALVVRQARVADVLGRLADHRSSEAQASPRVEIRHRPGVYHRVAQPMNFARVRRA